MSDEETEFFDQLLTIGLPTMVGMWIMQSYRYAF